MPEISSYDERRIQEFMGLIAPWSTAYKDATFSFLGVKNGDHISLAQGHVILPTGKQLPPLFEVVTPSICAGSIRLSTLGLDCSSLIDALVGDGVQTPVGRLVFGVRNGQEESVSAYLERYPRNFYDAQALTVLLSLSCSQHAFVNRQAEFQNDLRAADTPYDSATELAGLLALRPLRWDACTLDFSAHAVVAIDLQREIRDGATTLALLAAHGIDLTPAKLGYRVLVNGQTVQRRAVKAEELSWRDTEAYRVGELEIELPEGAIVQCFASYGGHWIHQGWLVRPGSFVNSRRVSHEAFDANLENTRRYLSDEKLLKQDSRHFEYAIANLLYMLGFAVDPLFGPLMRDNPDLLASTPSGNIVVVECTTGAIDNEGKLTKLLTRTRTLEDKLRQSGHAHVRCLPVIVTSLPRGAIADLQPAKDAGIVVACAEDIEGALSRTLFPQNPDVLFEEQWQSVRPPQDSLFPELGTS
ncbi:hypothetical protein HI806_01915 [Ralstonia solanacearum]|nr:hypothetical protein BCR16_01810 [Ralstonia solanacearum FJAT-1458]QKL70119.1 hypothetical protein HI806_01915 [Ralstonia solanacearum]QKL75332.1 hypothetical protein HI805_01915 [Ralstonia solanacearum]QKL80533.1 hypothetical protein HI804_01920 [Ralstonia solanacearum]QKL85746.1 hypothetical protein HI803_01920 [Ralstonia solanacearum]